MTEKDKLIKLTKMYDEMCEIFPDGSLSIMLHKIKEKNIPKNLFKFNRILENNNGIKTFGYINEFNPSFEITLFVDKEGRI